MKPRSEAIRAAVGVSEALAARRVAGSIGCARRHSCKHFKVLRPHHRSVVSSMAKHKGQKAKNKSKGREGPSTPRTRRHAQQETEDASAKAAVVASYLQQKRALSTIRRSHGEAGVAEEVKKAWNGQPETLFFLQNSMNAREVTTTTATGAADRRAGAARRAAAGARGRAGRRCGALRHALAVRARSSAGPRTANPTYFRLLSGAEKGSTRLGPVDAPPKPRAALFHHERSHRGHLELDDDSGA